MNYFRPFYMSLCSLAALFALTKLMGRKQISQMNMFDYVIGISIGSIAADMVFEEDNILVGFIGMAVYALAAYILSMMQNRSAKAQSVISGMPMILFDDGVFMDESFRKARMDINEFLIMCRQQGFFDLTQIQTAMFEHNGLLSVIPKADSRPATASDISAVRPQEYLPINVICNRRLIDDNLQKAGVSPDWVRNQVRKMGCGGVEDVYLACVDSNRNLSVFPAKAKGRRQAHLD